MPGASSLLATIPPLVVLALLKVMLPTADAKIWAADPVDYGRQIKPLLRERCYACHGALKRQAGLRLDTVEAMLEGGDGGPAIEPGHVEESLLIDLVSEPDPRFRMPPEGEATPLDSEQLDLLKAWIEQGANAPENEEPEPDPRRHWSFLPPIRPDIPSVQNSSWVRNPIDAFLAQQHDTLGLEPSTEAEPRVLLRRLYLDLTGLPPTLEQQREFLADPFEAAYEQLVDRLLASPQYGERWGRHWMDVWRYSDWYGRRAVPDVLNSYGMIWRWRDWIVRALNEDRGYDEMVLAMLAADEISPNDDGELAATGYLVRNFYRWNYNSWMKDNVEHVGKAFLALTFNCAHCHDHKYDPISHEDYFALRAVFEPIELRHDRVEGEPDPGPYPKYDYGKAYAPITSGMVRVFDEKLDAETFLYTRGESRNVVPNRPPIPPGMPKILGGNSFRVEPIDLPAEVAYPGLKGFVRQEEVSAKESALLQAEQALSESQSRLDAAVRTRAKVERSQAPGNPRAFAHSSIDILAFPEPQPPHAELVEARARVQEAHLSRLANEAQRAFARSDLAALQARMAADDARYGRTTGDVETLSRSASKAERQATLNGAKVALAKAELALDAARKQSPAAEITNAEGAREAARQAEEAARNALDQVDAEYTPLSPSYPAKSTGRRAALARWITDRANPLSARVAVNHVWRWHFGQPLVASTFDFGRNGAMPTHPELLDWLAVEMMEPTHSEGRPWSLKPLHRLIVTSSAYRMRSDNTDPDHPNRIQDPENRAYWHFPKARMEAEVIRDSLLHLAGRLDATLGGPDIDFSEGLTSPRRSLYFTHHGEARMTFLELFDAPDACDAYQRSTSVVPQQALALVNNELLLELSQTLADRLWIKAESVTDQDPVSAFLDSAFEQVLSRLPSSAERSLAKQFLDRQAEIIVQATRPEGSVEDVDSLARARRGLIHALFSHHDFLTIH